MNWPAHSHFFGRLRQKLARQSDGREQPQHEQPPSQNKRVISRRNCSWSGTMNPSPNIYTFVPYLLVNGNLFW
jgi:hypothetical protein